MPDFKPYRSRTILWLKERKDRNGATYYYDRAGKMLPDEVVRREYEPIEEKKD